MREDIMGSLSEAGEKMKEHGTRGLFTKKAKAAGKTVAEFAAEKKHAGGKLGKEANFAANAQRHFQKAK
jgi:hypothetical protein